VQVRVANKLLKETGSSGLEGGNIGKYYHAILQGVEKAGRLVTVKIRANFYRVAASRPRHSI
jgi:hypothetical protein